MTHLYAIVLMPFMVITGFFVLEVLAGLARSTETNSAAGKDAASTAIVVPANNEEAVIGTTLPAMMDAAAGQASILIVADNCTDRTASIARELGVAVIERNDPGRRGKGYALAHAAKSLEGLAPEVVIVLDADCSTDAGSISALISATATSGRPSQAVNLLRPAPGGSAMVQISTFAFLIKNLVRQRGLQRLAGAVHLTGTGMALPWTQFAQADLASESIVEDVRLGLELAEAGSAPQLVSGAQVWSEPSSQAGTLTQRTRWEGGYIAIAAKEAPRALWGSVTHLDARRLAAALDLCVLPLALLALMDIAVLVLAALATWLARAEWWPVVLHALFMIAAALALLLAWWREGRPYVSAGVLMRLPLYLLWKMPVYLRLAGRGKRIGWLRTGR